MPRTEYGPQQKDTRDKNREPSVRQPQIAALGDGQRSRPRRQPRGIFIARRGLGCRMYHPCIASIQFLTASFSLKSFSVSTLGHLGLRVFSIASVRKYVVRLTTYPYK